MIPRARSILIEVSICAAIVIAVVAYVFVPMWWLQHRAQDLVGASEAAVQAELGKPYKIVTATEIAVLPKGTKWWGESWSPAPAHHVSGKALLYYEGAAGVVIFVGQQGVVEHVVNIGT